MRIATIETMGGPRAAVQVGDEFVVLPFTMAKLLEAGEAGFEQAERTVERGGQRVPVAEAKYYAPVPEPHKIICLGLNYRDHAMEAGQPIPSEPILFSKFSTALVGHNANIVLPPVSKEVDYEAELVVVIGKKGKNIPEDQASSYVAGYTVGHDVSARDWQLKKEGGQWLAGKSFDTFAPCGPVMVTPDEVGDPHKLAIKLTLNGEVMQNSNTDQMIFSVPQMIAYMSQIFTLQPGDLIFTGTPPGVGNAREPQVFLKAGDTVEIEIEKLGKLVNPVVQG